MLANVNKDRDYSSDKWSDEEIITIEDIQKLEEKYGDHGLVAYFCRDKKQEVTNVLNEEESEYGIL